MESPHYIFQQREDKIACFEVNSLTHMQISHLSLSLSLELAIFKNSFFDFWLLGGLAPLNVYGGYSPDQTWKYVVALSFSQ